MSEPSTQNAVEEMLGYMGSYQSTSKTQAGSVDLQSLSLLPGLLAKSETF